MNSWIAIASRIVFSSEASEAVGGRSPGVPARRRSSVGRHRRLSRVGSARGYRGVVVGSPLVAIS
ncbi:hypothetical protein D8S78_15205 [Natrialba swarupiae]|nr:hypothetical protein [Natrialba swarupiae]